MDSLPLPPRPDLEQYRKRAKDLVTAARSGRDDAIRAWAKEWLGALARSVGVEITPFVQVSFDRAVDALERGVRERTDASRAKGVEFTLADAQFLMARAHGFESWPKFAKQVEQLSRKEEPAGVFESAVDAVVGGDISVLEELLGRDPDLIRARSAREHRASLLHYVAANGVEDYRQKTPANAVAIAKLLLASGAEVDALANTYGGGPAQTTLNLLLSSTHPAEAGLQVALAETLLDFGAAIEGLEDNGSPLMTALAFGYVDAAEALARRGAKAGNIVAAAALGRSDLVERLLADDAGVERPLVGLDWMGLSGGHRAQVERAFVLACAYGRIEVAELLLAHGVDPAATDNEPMTGLHWAAANGHMDVVKLLLGRGAPLEARNGARQSVLESTVSFARRFPDDAVYYAAVIEELLEAGADVRTVAYPTGNRRVDDVLKRHGARSG